jgi:hypothetical protein
LGNISDISDRFTIEVFEFDEVKKDTSTREVPDISDNIWKCCINIGLIEFSIKRKDFYTCIGARLFDFKLGKHKKVDKRYDIG